jgi:hypothetical protein
MRLSVADYTMESIKIGAQMNCIAESAMDFHQKRPARSLNALSIAENTTEHFTFAE